MADRGSGSCQRFGMPAMRILGGACGATVIALGVYDITQDSSDIGVVVNNVYRIIFGILILLSELRLVFLLKWFSFLTFFGGLGGFYIFVGGLAMGSRWYEIALAVVLCTMGILYLGSACACSEFAHAHQAETESKVSRHSDAAGAPGDIERPSPQPFREMEDGNARRGKMSASPFGDSEGDGYGHSGGAYNQGSGDLNPFANHKTQGSAYG